jgi:RNA polymerase sigma-70 factor, ECF subfamily
MDDLTQLANQAVNGDKAAQAALMEAVHQELHRLASREFRKEIGGHTLQTTALVNEAFLRLFGNRSIAIESRQHFYNLAARAMRRILVDHARARQAGKRPARDKRVELRDQTAFAEEDYATILGVHQALGKLAAIDPRAAQIVELRFFAGLSVEETAEAAGVSEKTVKRDFAVARAFLERELRTLEAEE